MFEEDSSYIMGIKTIVQPNDFDIMDIKGNSYFPERWDVRGYFSEIEFSEQLIGYKENENSKLTLKTIWFDLNKPYWQIWLENGKGYTFDSRRFNKLDESFGSYSEERLVN